MRRLPQVECTPTCMALWFSCNCRHVRNEKGAGGGERRWRWRHLRSRYCHGWWAAARPSRRLSGFRRSQALLQIMLDDPS